MTDPLSRLAIRYGTDKFGYHDYTPKYHRLLGHLRDAPLRMLEIGVGGYGDPLSGGESLEVWRDYFPEGRIVGLDIAEKKLDLGERVTILRGSQVDPDCLSALVAAHGPFDIILDDGSHRNEHVVESYSLLLDAVKPGGFYIVEDVQTAFFPRFGGSLALEEPNSVGLFADVLAALVTGGPMAEGISDLWRFHNIIALRKAGGDAAVPAIPAAAHLSAQALSEESLSAAMADVAPGQGVQVTCTDGLPDDLRRRFIEIDHREIAIHFADAPVSPLAREIHALHARAGVVDLEKGPNDYPSNFAFDADHPEAKAALEQSRRVLWDTPTERGLQLYGSICERAGWQQAVAETADLLATLPLREAGSFRLLFRAAKKAGQTERYRDTLEAAAAAFPADPGFAGQLASDLASRGQLERADEVVAAARAEGAASPDLSMRMSLIRLRQGRIAEALDEARDATAAKPRMAAGWVSLARIHLAAQDWEAAEAACVTGLEKSGNQHPALLTLLAESRIARRDTDGARAAVERGLRIAPGNPRLQRLSAGLDPAR